MAMKSKTKKPEKVVNPVATDYYKKNGNMFVEEGSQKIGYRYDQIEGRKLRKPDGTTFTNNVTLSQPASEVLTLMKDDGKWYMVLGLQARSPYVVDVDGQLYSKVFLEQAGGLLEEGQDFLEAAIAETDQELGVELTYISELVVPKLHKHTSYSDEMSKLYLAVTERKPGQQKLDKEENIQLKVYPLDEVREEFCDYINGNKPDFFGFDTTEMTMLNMTLLFWKLDSGEIDLENLKGNLLPQH